MKLTDHIVLGDRIELCIGRECYKSVVQDIPAALELLALHPLDARNLPIHLEAGEKFRIAYCRPNAMYEFTGQIVDRSREQGVATVRILAQDEEPQKVQRRTGFRFAYRMPVTLELLTQVEGAQSRYQLASANISEGGMLVRSPAALPVDTVAQVAFRPEDGGGEISLRACVRRVFPADREPKGWMLGLEFLSIAQKERTRIARFIIKEQMLRRAEERGN